MKVKLMDTLESVKFTKQFLEYRAFHGLLLSARNKEASRPSAIEIRKYVLINRLVMSTFIYIN